MARYEVGYSPGQRPRYEDGGRFRPAGGVCAEQTGKWAPAATYDDPEPPEPAQPTAKEIAAARKELQRREAQQQRRKASK